MFSNKADEDERKIFQPLHYRAHTKICPTILGEKNLACLVHRLVHLRIHFQYIAGTKDLKRCENWEKNTLAYWFENDFEVKSKYYHKIVFLFLELVYLEFSRYCSPNLSAGKGFNKTWQSEFPENLLRAGKIGYFAFPNGPNEFDGMPYPVSPFISVLNINVKVVSPFGGHETTGSRLEIHVKDIAHLSMLFTSVAGALNNFCQLTNAEQHGWDNPQQQCKPEILITSNLPDSCSNVRYPEILKRSVLLSAVKFE